MAILTGNANGHANGDSMDEASSGQPGLWITGLGHQYPDHVCGAREFEEMITKFYDVEKPGLQKLLAVNRNTGIDQRPCVQDMETFVRRPQIPNISDLNTLWLKYGVDLSAKACRKALEEWGGELSEITHVVACTLSWNGSPGVDLIVAEKLGLGPSVERICLTGVGCAGGLALMRVAAQLACAATARRKPAVILAFACELCSPNAWQELADAEASTNPEHLSPAAALFSDGAAAFVMSNDAGLVHSGHGPPLFQLLDWDNATIPNTMQELGWHPCPTGFRTTLTRNVAKHAAEAVAPMFSKLLSSFRDKVQSPHATAADLDWCLHPGGRAIIQRVQASMSLSEAQLSATKHIYKTCGNSSSPTVLIVLDTIRRAQSKNNIVAVSFGPGIAVEMAFLRRCCPNVDQLPS